MRSALLLVAAALIAGASSYVVVRLTAPPPGTSFAPSLMGVPDLQRRVSGLEQQLADLSARIGTLESVARRTRAAEAAAEDVESAGVEDGEAGAAPAAGEGVAESPAEEEEVTVEGLLAELTGSGIGGARSQALWGRAEEAGLLDELVAAFEARAEANPNDPDAQVDLGQAYLQKLFTVDQGPESGRWAIAADRAFDEALEIDPTHWQARFQKATSLSFWPPIFGKAAEAVRQFEIVIEQQESSGTTRPEHAQSYLFLGNLYQQQGNVEKAREVWQRGLRHHPQHAELKSALGR